MSKSRGGLGRGLAALIPTGPATNTVSDVFMGGAGRLVAVPTGTARHGASDLPPDPDDDQQRSSADAVTSGDGPRYADIPVTAIRPNPRNPRTVFDQDALDELAHSIREFGLLQPVVVRPVDGGYELVMGERRWRAAQQAGVETVAAIIRRTEDADLLRDALLENIHRTNLNPLEEAAAYQQLLEEFEVTQEELATRLGRSRPVISNTIRLLNLPIAVQRRVAAGVLSAGHARALLSLSEAGDQEDLAARIVAEGLSVRGAEEAVTLLARRTPTVRRSPARKMIMPGVQELATNLSDAFDTRVLVELGRRKGKIVVEFATVDDLERLVEIIAPAVAHRRKGLTPRPSAPSAASAPNAPTAGTVGGNGTDPADSTGSPSGPAVGRNSGSIPPGTLTGPADSESTVAEADSGQTADSVGIADTAAGIADGVGIADTAGLSDNVGIADSARLVDSAALVVRAGWADLYEVTATGFPAEPTAADHEAHADAPNAPVVDAGSEPENLNNRDGWGETEDRGDQATTSAYTDASLSGIDGASDGDGTPDAPNVSVSAEVVRATGSTSEGSEAGSPESADRLSDPAIP